MFELLQLVGFVSPLILIVLVVLAIRQSGTNARMASKLQLLETQLRGLDAKLNSAPVQPAATPVAPRVTAPLPTTVAPTTTEAPDAEPVILEPEVEELAEIAPADEPLPLPPPSEPPSPPTEPPQGRFEWERFIGLRLPVWLGAIALCIAGFFFVSYAIDSGFFTPSMRVLSAAAAALAFLAGAEFVRRRIKTGNVAAIASALAAAAIATAYATTYLASITYGLVPTGFAFIAAVAVSLLAIAIAMAYGQVVALVGMLGGYLVPVIFGGGEPSAAFVTIYVVALTAASFAVIRFKSWWRLSVIGLLGPAFWGIIWLFTRELISDTYWGDVFLIALTAIAFVATWPGWQEDGEIVGLTGRLGTMTPQRGTLIAALTLSAIGFVLFLVTAEGYAGASFGYWQGLIVFGALAVAAGFVSPPHRALQLPLLIATSIALLLWSPSDSGAALPIVVLCAIVYGFGALDQFRRMREPALWATVLAAVVVFDFAIALFKVTGWNAVLDNKHVWAIGAVVLAAGFVGLLRAFGNRVSPELVRSQVYAAWGGAVTTLVSLAFVLELDPLYFPAASALATLGLAAVHLRVPVRGLRIIAGVYAGIYALLLLGALFNYGYVPDYYRYVFASDLADHALVVLVLPGIALLAAATLFQRAAPFDSRRLVAPFDLGGVAVLALGLYYLLDVRHGFWPWRDMYAVLGPVAVAELVLALVAVELGRRLDRPMANLAGPILTGLVALGMLGAFVAPVYTFWPPYAVPGTVVFNVALIALGLPALLLFAIGWRLRQLDDRRVRFYGIGVSVFAVLVTYTLMLVDIRQAWHLGQPTLTGATSQSEYYAYSIGTLAFGIALLVIGVAFRHRGARALSFVFVLAATVKVFLFDAAALTGLWRVLSFLLMGLSFLGISWAYARFVFGIGLGRPAAKPEPPTAA